MGHDTFIGLCRAKDLLREMRDRPPSIKSVAREIHMSPFHFIRQFEALFGLTPHQFRIQARLDHARLLLATSEYSVTEVCLEVGLASLGSFSALFARRVGASPSAYQRRARTMVPASGALPPALFSGCLSLMGCLPDSAFRHFREAPAGVGSRRMRNGYRRRWQCESS